MNNPYTAPNAIMSEPESGEGTYQPKFFAVNGRIGRLRYISYLMISMLILIAGMAALLPLIGAFGLAMYIPIGIVIGIFARRRLNDLDNTGWYALILIFPIIGNLFSIYLMCAAGTRDANSYGLPPGPNSRAVVIGGLLLPIIAIVGILAAVAIPAYQGYLVKAKAKSAAAHSAP